MALSRLELGHLVYVMMFYCAELDAKELCVQTTSNSSHIIQLFCHSDTNRDVILVTRVAKYSLKSNELLEIAFRDGLSLFSPEQKKIGGENTQMPPMPKKTQTIPQEKTGDTTKRPETNNQHVHNETTTIPYKFLFYSSGSTTTAYDFSRGEWSSIKYIGILLPDPVNNRIYFNLFPHISYLQLPERTIHELLEYDAISQFVIDLQTREWFIIEGGSHRVLKIININETTKHPTTIQLLEYSIYIALDEDKKTIYCEVNDPFIVALSYNGSVKEKIQVRTMTNIYTLDRYRNRLITRFAYTRMFEIDTMTKMEHASRLNESHLAAQIDKSTILAMTRQGFYIYDRGWTLLTSLTPPIAIRSASTMAAV